jgi:hypothetical protein
VSGSTDSRVTLTQEARGLLEGDIVQTTYLPIGFDHIDLEVRTVEREQEILGALLAGWSAAIYVYTPGTLPIDPIPADEILFIPRPGGLELLGPPDNGCNPFPTIDPTTGGVRLIGRGNGDIFTGRDVRIRWHQTIPIFVKGLDEDNFDQGVSLIRDYLISVIGIIDVP